MFSRIKSKLASYYWPDNWSAARIARRQPDIGAVLMYHEVLPDDHGVPAWTVVQQSEFQRQMQFLVENFDIVSLDDGLGRLSGQTQDSRPFAVVTFDDGYGGVFDFVHPIMQELGIPYTVYLATEAIQDQTIYWYDKIINLLRSDEGISVEVPTNSGPLRITIPKTSKAKAKWNAIQNLLSLLKTLPQEERARIADIIHTTINSGESVLRMLTPSEIGQLAKSDLVTIGAHTHGHELLDQLANSQIRRTLSICGELITSWTGSRARHFAYPNGNYNEQVAAIVEEAGFTTAVTTEHGVWDSGTGTYQIPRLAVGRFDGMNLFRAKVSGLA